MVVPTRLASSTWRAVLVRGAETPGTLMALYRIEAPVVSLAFVRQRRRMDAAWRRPSLDTGPVATYAQTGMRAGRRSAADVRHISATVMESPAATPPSSDRTFAAFNGLVSI